MAVHDRMPRRLAAVHAHVEALDLIVLGQHLPSHLVEQQVDRAPLGLVEIKEALSVPTRHDQRMQRRYRVRIVEGDCQLVLRDDRTVRRMAEEAVSEPVGHQRRHGGTDDVSNLQALCYKCDATDLRAVRDGRM
jgi:hypothetical protein